MSDEPQNNIAEQIEPKPAMENQAPAADMAEELSHRLAAEKTAPQQSAHPRIVEPSLPDLSSDSGMGNLSMLMGVNLNLTVELGRANLSVRQVLDLQKGSVVELDRIAGEAVDVYVNDRLIARGDVVVVDDKFGVRITELISPNPAG
ncbi:MAG: flagellar motor switch protein FliN [Anaerolineae bacterium]|nr:flagellar motor switch protein FliN [Anaerolineae bacterium]